MYDGLIERLRTAAGPKYTGGSCFVSNEDLHDAAFLLESLSERYKKALSDLVKESNSKRQCPVCGRENCFVCAYCGADMRGDIDV